MEPLGEQYKDALQQLKKIVEKEDKLDLEKTKSAKGIKRLKKEKSLWLIKLARYNCIFNSSNYINFKLNYKEYLFSHKT